MKMIENLSCDLLSNVHQKEHGLAFGTFVRLTFSMHKSGSWTFFELGTASTQGLGSIFSCMTGETTEITLFIAFGSATIGKITDIALPIHV